MCALPMLIVYDKSIDDTELYFSRENMIFFSIFKTYEIALNIIEVLSK